MTEVAELGRWTPVRKGPIFCSPGCGSGCTHAAYQRAVAEAAELVAALGDGWAPRIWENGGWHYSVKKGPATVCAHVTGSSISGLWQVRDYSADVDTASQVLTHADDPRSALDAAMKEMRRIERRLNFDLAVIAA